MKTYFTVLIYILTLTSASAQPATLLYFNDAHQLSPIHDRLGDRGGMARLKTIIDTVKAKQPDALVLFGGDLGGGLLLGAMFNGIPMVEAMNELPVDIANFGQHDFDFGAEETRGLVAASEFQWLSSNLVETDGSPFAGAAPFIIKKVAKLRIGFIGLTDEMNTTMPDSSVSQRDLLESAQSAVDSLQNRHVDAIIAIIQADLEINEKLLNQIPAIDAVFSEEIDENKTNVTYIGHRPIISPCGNIGSLAQLDLWRGTSRIQHSLQVHTINETVAEDSAMVELEAIYDIMMEAYLSDTLAILDTELDAGINTDFRCRWKECNVGNLLTDIYRHHYNADIALMNAGGIRANIPSGPFTMEDAQSVIPFNNVICLVKTSGAIIIQALQHGLSQVEEKKGKFLQVSGLSYRYDYSKTGAERLTNSEVAGQPLDPDRNYTVALPNFLLNGGDGFDMLIQVEVLVDEKNALTDIEIVEEYCRQYKHLSPQIEGRIEVENYHGN